MFIFCFIVVFTKREWEYNLLYICDLVCVLVVLALVLLCRIIREKGNFIFRITVLLFVKVVLVFVLLGKEQKKWKYDLYICNLAHSCWFVL